MTVVDIVALRAHAQRAAPGDASEGAVPLRAVPSGGVPSGTPSRVGSPVAALVRTVGLTGLLRPASEQSEAAAVNTDRMLPVLPELRHLLPGGGLRRGSTVAVRGGPGGSPGAATVLLALLSAASEAGSWCAVLGLPDLGAVAAAELGIALDRLALVPYPGPEWPAVVAALLDGLDLVVVAVPGPVGATIAGRLAARARQRGGVLIPYGEWSGADVVLEPAGDGWYGLGDGIGRLARRRLVVASHGRGAAARPRQVTFWLPRDSSRPAPAELPAPTQLRPAAVAG
jgi:hypothetical protein